MYAVAMWSSWSLLFAIVVGAFCLHSVVENSAPVQKVIYVAVDGQAVHSQLFSQWAIPQTVRDLPPQWWLSR
jgi:hypothetical protein